MKGVEQSSTLGQPDDSGHEFTDYRARKESGETISLNGATAIKGNLATLMDEGALDARLDHVDVVEPTFVVDQLGAMLDAEAGELDATVASGHRSDGTPYTEVVVFPDADGQDGIGGEDGYRVRYEEGTWTQTVVPSSSLSNGQLGPYEHLGDEPFRGERYGPHRPAASDEFELPDGEESGKGELLPAEADDSGNRETGRLPGEGDHPAGDAHIAQIASDEQTQGTGVRDPGPLAGEALPSDSTGEAMKEAWGTPSFPGGDAGSRSEPDAVVLPDDPTTLRDNWGRNTDALDGAGMDWGPNEAGEAAPAELVEALATARQYSGAREDEEHLERLREDPEIEADELSDEALLLHRAEQAPAEGEALGLDEAHRFDTASRLNDRFAEQGIDLEGAPLEDLVVHQQEGRLVVGIRDPDQPDAANDGRPASQGMTARVGGFPHRFVGHVLQSASTNATCIQTCARAVLATLNGRVGGKRRWPSAERAT